MSAYLIFMREKTLDERELAASLQGRPPDSCRASRKGSRALRCA